MLLGNPEPVPRAAHFSFPSFSSTRGSGMPYNRLSCFDDNLHAYHPTSRPEEGSYDLLSVLLDFQTEIGICFSKKK
jgi:hypothetical protein